jgi:hypothetical protein
MTNWQSWNRSNQKFWRLSQPGWPRLLLSGLTLITTLALANATPVFDAESPIGFFTNVASRLLSSELNLDLTRIQIYPTNQYTPAVHRLLQVTANVYDATTTNFYPSVFRPLFSRDADGLGTNVFISGYTNVPSVTGPTDNQFALPMDVSDLSTMGGPVINLAVNVYGVPWIIGAKKGFPNFNELAMENAFQLTRKLQVVRSSTNAQVNTYSYNQMYLLNLTNRLGVECWNSYAGNYTNPVTIYATAYLKNVILTNDEGFSTNLSFITSGVLPVNNWPGYNPYLASPSFQIPLNTSIAVIPLTTYHFNGGSPYLTTNLALPYETNLPPDIPGYPYPQPHWWLMVTNNLRVIMVDTMVTPNHVIDYVQLRGPNSVRDLDAEIQTLNTSPYTGFHGLWATNLNAQDVPSGLANQLSVSLGLYGLNSGNGLGSWGAMDPTQVTNEINGFRVFYHLMVLPPFQTSQYDWAAATNSIQAPFTPVANVVQHISWQANDPLVHYLASDLNGPNASHLDHTTDALTDENLGVLNQRYTPWGGNPMFYGADQNPYYSAIKDPLVWQSDDWNFPTHESLAGDCLGRVHRGTPWQTIYLKATDVLAATSMFGYIGTNTWMNWTGDLDANDAVAMAPLRDRHLASLLASMFNTNDFWLLFSVNNPNPEAWQALLDGLTVLTNDLPDSQIKFGVPQFGLLVISSNSPQASFIANAIQSARTGRPGQFFRDVGDILTTPQLTEQSPFLNRSSGIQITNGISDEAYEIIPSQLLSLLRADSIGSIVSTSGPMLVRFTGYDGHAYVIQVSSNLMNWTDLSTNYPLNGTFGITNFAAPGASPRFYRSVLLP